MAGKWATAACGLATGFFISSQLLASLRLAFAKFRFHALTEPLLDHALVIQEARPGQALDAREHPRVDAQGDGDRLGDFLTVGHRRFHEPDVEPVIRPKGCLRLFAVEERHIIPTGNRIHRLIETRYALPSVWFILR